MHVIVDKTKKKKNHLHIYTHEIPRSWLDTATQTAYKLVKLIKLNLNIVLLYF
jgi:hypothetical protein